MRLCRWDIESRALRAIVEERAESGGSWVWRLVAVFGGLREEQAAPVRVGPLWHFGALLLHYLYQSELREPPPSSTGASCVRAEGPMGRPAESASILERTFRLHLMSSYGRQTAGRMPVPQLCR